MYRRSLKHAEVILFAYIFLKKMDVDLLKIHKIKKQKSGVITSYFKNVYFLCYNNGKHVYMQQIRQLSSYQNEIYIMD